MRRTLRLCPLLALLLAVTLGGAGRAQALELQPGQQVGVGVEAALAAGSAISIVGNAVTLAQGKPDRSWLITSYFFGTLNMVVSPLMFVYGQAPEPSFGLAMGAMHAALGIANFALGVYGGVRYSRAMREKASTPSPAAALPGGRPSLALVPVVGRDSGGLPFLGAAVSLSRF